MRVQFTTIALGIGLMAQLVTGDCTLPDFVPVWDTDDTPFSIVLSTTDANLNSQALYFTGTGSDKIPAFYTGSPPAGSAPVSDFTLDSGVWKTSTGVGLHAVVSSQVGTDQTALVFFTTRKQTDAELEGFLGCDPNPAPGEEDGWMVFFRLKDGAGLCVRKNGNRWELRRKPLGVSAVSCIDVKLGKVPKLWPQD